MKGADQCPKCASRKWAEAEQPITPFYARALRVCANCATAWEPFEISELLDADDPRSSFHEPCSNCAFRPDSPEQKNKEEWKKLIQSLSEGAQFYCHKGVPITPGEGHGFAYPTRPDGTPDRSRLRLCRGYLKMRRAQWDRECAQEDALG